MNQSQGIEYLESHGIDLFHAFDTPALAEQIGSAVPTIDLDEYPTTVLIANAGTTLWHSMKQAGMSSGADPVDRYSVHLARQYAERFLNTEAEILYPSDYPISLREIGAKTGWSYTTPMGITIHPKFGTWYAYRALFMVKTQLPASSPLLADHPCESCTDKPCITVCPSGAVGENGSFGLETCAKYRIEDHSPCAYQCLSRISCPVGTEYHYVPEQMKYHYNRSRTTMIRYFGGQSAS